MNALLLLSVLVQAPLAQHTGIPDDAPRVRVEIQTDSPDVELFRVVSEGVGTVATARGGATVSIVNFQRECRAPCNRLILEPRSDFFIAGDGVTPSRRFSLMDYGPNVRVNVKAGSAVTRAVGYTATLMGITGAVLGGTTLAVSGMLRPSGPSLASSSSGGSTLSTVGWASLGGGVALLGAGIPMMVFSGTEVKVADQPRPDDADPAAARSTSIRL